jgi:simple sugar transport system ATP-binding protein
MRSGKVVGTSDTSQVTVEEISRMMVGRDVVLRALRPKAADGPSEVRLLVKNVDVVRDGTHVLKDVSLQVRTGEILGVAGVEGNGQVELVEVITGLSSCDKGEIWICGQDATGKSPGEIRDMGLSHIPQDRMVLGVASRASISENLISTWYNKQPVSNGFSLDIKAISKLGQELISRFDIKASSAQQSVGTLSGGNIQKVVIAREFSTGPQVIIANQPTRGIDIGATESAHKYLVEATEIGTAVLLVSADLTEVMSLSNRLIVMYEGQVVAYFDEAQGLDEEEIGLYMLGLKRQEPDEVIASMMGRPVE